MGLVYSLQMVELYGISVPFNPPHLFGCGQVLLGSFLPSKSFFLHDGTLVRDVMNFSRIFTTNMFLKRFPAVSISA